MTQIDPKLAPSRFNRVGTSGNRGTVSNVVDSYVETFELDVTAQTGSTTLTTDVILPSHIQSIGAFVIVDTAEVTGTTATLTVGFSGETDALMGATSCGALGTVGSPTAAGAANPNGETLLVTFGSSDWEEFVGRLVIKCVCVR